jgi:hypothetical protein
VDRDDDVDGVTGLHEEVESLRAIDDEGDGLLPGLQLGREVLGARAESDGGLRDLRARRDVEERRLALHLRRVAERDLDDRVNLDLARLHAVGGDGLTDGDVLGGDQDGLHAGTHLLLLSGLLVQHHDDADERQNGEQHSDQDDEPIRSLHSRCTPTSKIPMKMR